jgi:pterin-4a-carbinolamine dehydratase
MTADDTRRAMLATGQPTADLAAEKGQTWTTADLQREFEITGFMAPFVVVKRRSDGAVGSLEFQHHPRIYFSWKAD